MAQLEFFASCLPGLEGSVAAELKSFSIERVRPLKGGVAFFCEPQQAYRACLWSRLAARIALVLGRVDASDAEVYYRQIHGLEWEAIIGPDTAFAVRAHGTNDQLRNTRFSALKAKDAIADRLRGLREGSEGPREGRRASVDIRLHGKRATVSLDFCGEALSHRPYLLPDENQDAPHRVALAAAALALGDWASAAQEGCPLVDPACADGIMLVEAASIACDRAPSLEREAWGFMGWEGFDASLWEPLLDEARQRFEAGLARFAAPGKAADPTVPDLRKVRYVGTASSSPAIARARKHGRRAGLRYGISVELGDASGQEAVVRRVGAAAPEAAGRCMVACSLDSRQRSDAAAAVRADEAAFIAACRAVGEQCRAIAVEGADLLTRFPEGARRAYTVGKGRVEAAIEVFDGPVAASNTVEVSDLATGDLHSIEVYESTADQFAARLRKVFKERRKQAAREGVSCYRVYDYDLPEYAVAIDWYQGAGRARGHSYLSIAEYAPPASVDEGRARRRFHDVLAIAPVVCGIRPDHVFSKRRMRAKGGGQYRQPQGRAYATTVEEGGLTFEVDLAQRLDTGLFLDHRPTRELLRRKAKGAAFLNLFAYTGTASVYAAAGGARSTLTVDLSQTYIDWARRNMEANGFSGPRHSFQRADVLQWVTGARRERQRYDLIFVDPPTFSNSKAMGKKTWDVQRDHAELLIGVAHLLAEGGCAVFSCNLRNFKPDIQKLQKYGVVLEDITPETIPFDFARTPKIHHCYIVRRAR